jgi:pyruvate ferredoxin oxidoreductase beta subunit
MAKLAVETRIFPIYEIEEGRYRINVMVSKPRPIEDYLKAQRRFVYLLRPENAHLLERFKKLVEDRWNHLLKMAEAFPAK